MARLTTGFEYQPIIAPYAPAPVEEFREALDERSGVFDRNVGEMDKLDILANNIDVLDPDKDIKLAEIDRIRQSLNQVTEMGAENATSLVRATARDFASNSTLRGASEKFAFEQQRQEDIRQMRLKGETPYDFTPEYKGYLQTPDWRPSVESANDVLADAKKYVGTIKDKFRDLGWNIIQKTDPDGVKYTVAVTGEGQEVSRAMIEERIGGVIDEFMQSPTGGNQYSRWSEFNGENSRDAAYDMLKTAAFEQEGERTQRKYQVLRTDESGASGATQVPDSGVRGLPSANEQRMDQNFNIKELSTFDEFIQRLRASGGDFRKVDSPVGPFTVREPGKGDPKNEFARESLEPYTKRALTRIYPQLSSSDIQEMTDKAFNSDTFILDQPEIKQGLEQYYEDIKDFQSVPFIIDPNIGATTTRELDKKFTSENIEKEIRSTFKQRRYKTTIDGKVVDITDDVIKILNESPNSMDVAGIYDIMHHFIEPDPDTQINDREVSAQTFAQPYAVNLRIPDTFKGNLKILEKGQPVEVAVSREFGHVVGRDGDKEMWQTAAFLHNQAVRNFGEFVEVDLNQVPYISQSVGGSPIRILATMDPKTKKPVYEIESDATITLGSKREDVYIRTNPAERPEQALAQYIFVVAQKRQDMLNPQ